MSVGVAAPAATPRERIGHPWRTMTHEPPAPMPVPAAAPTPAPAAAPDSTPPPAGAPAAVLRAAIVYSILFGAQGAYLPYISLYLAASGLGLGSVGALIALFAAVSLIAAPAWGALADGIGDVRGPVLVAGLLSGAVVALLAVAVGPLALAIAMALLAATWAGVIPMIDSQAVRLVGRRERYGQARAPGSGAFVVVTFLTGAVIGSLGPGGMYLVYGPLVVLTGLAGWLLLRLPRSDTRRAAGAGRGSGGISPATLMAVLRTPRLGVFFIASVVLWTSHAALQGFITLRVQQLGGDGLTIAATWSLGALLEVPLMTAFPALARRFGAERLLVIGAACFAIRALVSAVVDAPILIVLASAFGGVGFSFVYVGTVIWVAGAVGRGAQATAQGIFSGTSNSIGAIVGSIVGGAIGGAFGLPVLFGLAAVGYALGAILVWLAVGRSREGQTPGGSPLSRPAPRPRHIASA